MVYVLKCLIDPDIPVNDGFYRLVDIRSRPGSVVHAKHPAAVAAGWEIAMQLCDLLFKALAPALPDRVVAGTKGCVCNIAFGGINPATGEYFTYYETIAGGYGATLTNDGMDAVQAHFQNTENAPVEETEANYPVRILRYELIEDSEGGGRHRGGLGVRRDYTLPRPHAELLDPLRQGQVRPVGSLRRRAGAARQVHPEPGHAGGARAALEDHLPAQAGRRRQRADAGRRRHRVGARARPPSAWPRTWPRGRSRPSAPAPSTAWSSIRRRRTLDAGRHRRRARAESLMRALRLGIDIGGTFTDAALVDVRPGQIRVVKVLTTPVDPAMGFMAALERGLPSAQAGGGDVAAVVHATTVATNALIEGKTARVGMLVTRGFRDILEIGRQIRSRLYDVHLQKPAPLVPRRWSLEVTRAPRRRGPGAGAAGRSKLRARRCGSCGSEGVEAVVDLLSALLSESGPRARGRRRSCARRCRTPFCPSRRTCARSSASTCAPAPPP